MIVVKREKSPQCCSRHSWCWWSGYTSRGAQLCHRCPPTPDSPSISALLRIQAWSHTQYLDISSSPQLATHTTHLPWQQSTLNIPSYPTRWVNLPFLSRRLPWPSVFSSSPEDLFGCQLTFFPISLLRIIRVKLTLPDKQHFFLHSALSIPADLEGWPSLLTFALPSMVSSLTIWLLLYL